MFKIKFQQVANHALDLVYARVAKFYNLTAIYTDNVIMLMVTVRFLKLSHIFTKLVFGNQITTYQ